MIQEIFSYCSPSEINDCVTDCLAILTKDDWTKQAYFNSSIQAIVEENKKLSITIGTVRSSKFAAILENDDRSRGRLLRGLTQVTKASMLRKDSLVAESATEVYRVIKAHGLDLMHKSYQSESAGIDSLAYELNSDKMKAHLDDLPESKAFLMELIPVNEQFKRHFDQKMKHKAEIEKLNSPTVQKKLVRERFNKQVVRFINMMSEIDPATFKPTAKKLEPYTEQINRIAKSRKSRKEQEAVPTAEIQEENN